MIFCIGLHKTGTVSLREALKRLGYNPRHGFKKHSDQIIKNMHKGRDPLKGFEQYDAFLDLYAIEDHFAYFAEYYPESKFILTTRDSYEWVESCKRQIKKRPNSPYFHYWYYQTDVQRILHKEAHESAARSYFANKGRLLEMNIMEADGYDKLCPFLEKETINEPFPHKNVSPR